MLKMYVDYAMALVGRKIKSEKAQGMVEYGLIIGLVAVLLIAALTAMRGQLVAIFEKITNTLSNVNSQAT